MGQGNQDVDKALRQIVDSAARYRLAVLRYTDSVYDDKIIDKGKAIQIKITAKFCSFIFHLSFSF